MSAAMMAGGACSDELVKAHSRSRPCRHYPGKEGNKKNRLTARK
jgi:hypothetical protein